MASRGRPRGRSQLAPQKRTMTAAVVAAYDTGKFTGSAALIAHLNKVDGRRFTYSHISGALNKWRPDWVNLF